MYEKAFTWAGRVGACDARDTIVIVGAPRSGTTLMLEVLHKTDGYKAVNEPLQVRYAGEKLGFGHRTFLEPGQDAPTQRAYLEAVCTGQLGAGAPWMFTSPSHVGRCVEHATRRRLVVKFCRLNRMLHWFARHFEVRGIVYVVRHPCAAVSSMLKHGAWERTLQRKGEAGFPLDITALPAPVQERFRPILEGVETQEEALAAMWCLDNYIPLLHYDEHPWIMAPYERLVMQGEGELRRIAHALGVRVNDRMVRGLDQPSISARGQLKKDPEVQLSKWRAHLSERQIDNIMRIVNGAGLSSLYDTEPMPRYERLNTYQDPRWRWS